MSALRPILIALASVGCLFGCSEPAEEAAMPAPELKVAAEIAPEPEPSPMQALIERGKRLELDTPYEPPPGDPDAHFTMGFARTLCSGVFISGLDEDFAAKNIGYFTSPLETRQTVVKRNVEYENKTVSLTTESGITRTAKYIGDLGCVPLPFGETEPFFEPPEIVSRD